MTATYKDLQQATGLSLATISKFYNGGTVRDGNARAIEQAAERLGYRPNGVARSLRSRRSGTIGVLLPALDNDFHLTVIAGVESALRPYGMSVIVSSSPDAAAGAVDLLLSRMVDGIVAVPSRHDVDALRRAAERVPVVQVDWRADGLDTDGVYLDNHGAGALAARHLVDHGHRRLAVIGGDPAISTMRERTEGFLDVARAHGAQVDDAAVSGGPLTVENGRDAMQRLLVLPERPSAVFCANYELTLGAVITLNESGLRLGQDLSVAGFDGLELAQATVPKLTVVVQPTHELAVRAAERIRERLDERGRDRPGSAVRDVADPIDVVVPPRLVAGGSVARLPRPDALEA
ncbi:LacI family transcriptional regulator [Curtobacterium sp. 'Ferrero']|uniref:LacI family DNA-binding transcriptional regulator n=1 Tax=Curtobacterium sp. 'Ferrero' TaxID=2033654 RepID=UPI000BDBC8AA|nr:LacI family DNA-binding transcriptional regulator [Curtobacterium sp. 'Ferrero']PCN48544.1 LacI family transcriptional regulator [Curtobacterium sp. 'Ferrero']